MASKNVERTKNLDGQPKLVRSYFLSSTVFQIFTLIFGLPPEEFADFWDSDKPARWLLNWLKKHGLLHKYNYTFLRYIDLLIPKIMDGKLGLRHCEDILLRGYMIPPIHYQNPPRMKDWHSMFVWSESSTQTH